MIQLLNWSAKSISFEKGNTKDWTSNGTRKRKDPTLQRAVETGLMLGKMRLELLKRLERPNYFAIPIVSLPPYDHMIDAIQVVGIVSNCPRLNLSSNIERGFPRPRRRRRGHSVHHSLHRVFFLPRSFSHREGNFRYRSHFVHIPL